MNNGPVDVIELANEQLTVRLLTIGASLWQVVPAGSDRSLCLALNDPGSYEDNPSYMGVTAGPVANRIRNASFALDGRRFELEANEGRNQLHGGPLGFGHRHWQVERDPDGATASFRLLRPAGEGGYPGNLEVLVTYSLHDATLRYRWTATTDAATPVSLTNHAYWNLAGGGTIEEHTLRVAAERVVEVDAASLPTGRLLDVADTGFDLRKPTVLGQAMAAFDPPGIDSTFCLDGQPAASDEKPTTIELSDPGSGRRLLIATTLPGVQVYTGQHLSGGPRDAGHGAFDGVCLETQYYPDFTNHPGFPAGIVRPGHEMRHETDYRFVL